MPDFGSWSLQDWGNFGALLAGVAGIIGIIVGGLWALLTGLVNRWKEELADPESLRDLQPHFNDFDVRNRYRHALESALDAADSFFGQRLISWCAYSVCLSIAFFYPIVLYLVTWALGGPHSVGTLKLLPEGLPVAMRLTLSVSLVLYGCATTLVVTHSEKINEWINRRASGGKWHFGILVTLAGLIGGVIGYVITGGVVKAIAFAGAGVLSATLVLVIRTLNLFTHFTFYFAFYFRTPVSILGVRPFVYIAVIAALVGAFVLALVYLIPVTGTGAVTVVVAFVGVGGVAVVLPRVFAGVLAGVLAGVILAAAALSGFITGTWMAFFSPEVMSLLLFFFLLPSLNAALDTVSWAVSRWLGREVLRHNFQWKSVGFFAFMDLLAAGVLLLGLAVVLGAAGEAIDQFSLTVVGKHILNLDSMIAQAATDPLGDGLWITFMLLSTIVPTAIHAVVATGSAIQIWGWKEQREEWRDEVNESVEENEGLTSNRTRNKIAWYWALWSWLPPTIIVVLITLLLAWQIPYLPAWILEAAQIGRSLVG